MPTLRLSIVTPTYNSATYLRDTLESVHASVPDDVEIEHIVVDGGSRDATVAIAREYPCTIIEGEDEGIYDAMNIGIRRAGGELIGIINSDDTLIPGALAALSEWFEDRRSDWVVGGMRWVDADGVPHAELPPPPNWMTIEMLASVGWNPIHHPATFLTRSLYDAIGEFDLSYSIAADYDLLLRAMSHQPFDRLERPLVAFRRHGESASLSMGKQSRDESERVARAYGPASEVRRRQYRAFVRLWLNVTNPRWFVAKRRGKV